MSDSSQTPWSDNPDAPIIPYFIYFAEKATFAGIVVGGIFYGIAVVLFFQCMGALLGPVDRTKGGIKWGLVAYVTAMFSFATIYTGMSLDIQSISYVDYREFSGDDGVGDPGPLGYQTLVFSDAINVVPNTMFLLNNWLADGFLLYRCYIIYAMNYWALAFPCLMYLASLTMGITLTYSISQPGKKWGILDIDLGLAYYSLSVSLNIILTLMIVARLVLHSRSLQNAMGTAPRTIRLYKTIVTMLIESSALYAVVFLLYIGPWGANSNISDFFFPILAETQVIAPFLIILRVANRRALTSSTIISGNFDSIQFRKSTSGNGTLPDDDPANSTGTHGGTHGEPGIDVETPLAGVPS